MEYVATPDSLLSLATLATAKHVSCREMESYPQPWDEDLLKKVSFLACPQDAELIKTIARVNLRDDEAWKRGEDYLSEDKIKDLRQVGFIVTAVVEDFNVSFTFEKQQITSTSCESCKDIIWCSHVIAAILYRIHNSKLIPIHPPVTETLSSLDRNQLQKLLQYAIKEYPAGILGKVFMWVDQVRDSKSQVNETPGLPDPTFGLALEQAPTLDLTINELGRSFSSTCETVGRGYCTFLSDHTDFPCSKEESRIRDSDCYKSFIQRVVDFVQIGEVETAGQILITLITEAANVALIREGNITKKYENLLKTLERVCCLYILEFTGKARSKLIELCERLNKTTNITSNCSGWAELPKLSLLFPFDSADEPGVMNANQKSMFYEPLCVSLMPDPSQEFYKLLSGDVLLSNSKYDEPLPLMIMRFESLRFWDISENGQKKVLNLGAVILRKLMQATQTLTALSDRNILHADIRTTAASMKRQRPMDDAVTGIPLKKRNVSNKTTDGTKDGFLTPIERTVMETERKNVNKEKPTNESDHDSSSSKGGIRCTYTNICDLMADATKQNSFETINIESVNEANRLRLMLNPFETQTQQHDANNLPKEMLSFCLSHITFSMYQAKTVNNLLSETERQLIASATLRALELTRYQIKSSLSEEDHSILQSLQQNLSECYKEHIDNLVQPSFSAGLETMYVKMLCYCNKDNVCFFDNALPLPLIAFLVKRALQDCTSTPEQKQQACHLCLYTLCHSDKPYDIPSNNSNHYYYDECSVPYGLWKKAFKDIIEMFLDYIKDMPEGDVLLTKLLTHYSKIQDKNAVLKVFKIFQRFPREGLSEEALIAMTKVVLNGIAICSSCSLKPYDLNFAEMLEYVFAKLGSVFITLVLDRWADIVRYFSSDYLDKLVEKMKTFVTHDNPLTESMLNSITKYYAGAFEHNTEAVVLLKLFEKCDTNSKAVFDAIRLNSDNFTPKALLGVAKNSMEHWDVLVYEDVNYISEKIFTDYAFEMIKLALKRIEHISKSGATNTSRNNYSDTFSQEPDPAIQWVFQALLRESRISLTAYIQSEEIFSLLHEAYCEDLQTIISLLSLFEEDELLFHTCKTTFGERVLYLGRKALIQATKSLKPGSYKSFLTWVDKVKDYFAKYVADGSEAFKVLLQDIQSQNKSKRKLIRELRDAYDF